MFTPATRSILVIFSIPASVVIAGFAAPAIEANCIPATTFGSIQRSDPHHYTYVDFDDSTGDPSHFVGRFWQTDAPSQNEGDYDVTNWLAGYAGYPNYWYLAWGNLGDARVQGCPRESMTVFIEDTLTSKFVLWTVGISLPPHFDFSFNGPPYFFDAPDSPRPRVDGLRCIGPTAVVDYTVPDPTPGVVAAGPFTSPGNITEVRLYSQTSVDLPGSDLPGEWDLEQTLGPTGGSSTVEIECSDTPLWLATALVVEGVEPYFVVRPMQMDCNCNSVPFARFDMQRVVMTYLKSEADSFSFSAQYQLGENSDGINPELEDVKVSFGAYQETLVAGSFTCTILGCGYKGVGPGIVQARITSNRLDARAEGLDLSENTNPVDVSVYIGDDGGSARTRLHGTLGFTAGLAARARAKDANQLGTPRESRKE